MRGIGHILRGLNSLRSDEVANADADSARPSMNRGGRVDHGPGEHGIPALSIEEVLEAHQDIIDRIKMCYGMDRAAFERDVLSLIKRYAQFVHLLPATADNYFNGPGGLLRLGLEVAFFSLQGTDGHIFSGRSTITTRRHLEPRWRDATFIAGLCCEIHRPLSQVVVTSKNGDEWQPYLLPLSNWLNKHRAARFFVKWLPEVDDSPALAAFVLPHVISSQTVQDLASGNSIVVPHMMASICGMPVYRGRNILGGLVRRSVALVIDRHLKRSVSQCGKGPLGSHLRRYFIDAMQRLMASNAAWKPNSEKSRVWFGADGLFIVWPNAAADIHKLIESDQTPGIPKVPETMLDILLAAGVFKPSTSAATWQIVPPGSKTAIEAVKVSSPGVLFAGIGSAPSPLGITLARKEAESASSSSPAWVTSLARGNPAVSHAVTNTPSIETRQLLLPIEATPNKEGERPMKLPIHKAEANCVDQCTPVGVVRTAASSPVHPHFQLEAPMRVNRAVREALADIVDTLNQNVSKVAACAIPSGLFIPLEEFGHRNIEPSLALRALAEVKMLVSHGRTASQTVAHDLCGEHKVGLVLCAEFVKGLDPRHSGARSKEARCADS